MSSSIAIPQRKKKMLSDSHVASSASSSSSSYESFVDTSRTPQASSSVLTPSARYYYDRRPSLLSRSLSISVHFPAPDLHLATAVHARDPQEALKETIGLILLCLKIALSGIVAGGVDGGPVAADHRFACG